MQWEAAEPTVAIQPAHCSPNKYRHALTYSGSIYNGVKAVPTE